jgi:hypothetical protein
MASVNNTPIPVVYYHSIGAVNPQWKRNFLTLRLPFFEDQLKYYKRNFSLLTLKEYYNIKTGNQERPKSPLVITIDDGYLDNWIWAFPLIKKYEIPVTIFVSPEMVDPRNIIRPNIEDYKSGKVVYKDLKKVGHLSWQEMRLMEAYGLIDIQSHTMSHTKYFISDKIMDFHNPKADSLYPIGNRYPEEKPFHMANPNFEKLLPYGFPFFEEASSVIAKKVEINPEFTRECVAALATYNFDQYKFDEALQKVTPIYQEYIKNNTLIIAVENKKQQLDRIKYEIVESKNIIEKELNKKVEFLCWPHGDNDPAAHELAIGSGYLATTTGSNEKLMDSPDRIPNRIGIFHVRNNRLLSKLKARYKIGYHLGQSPWKELNKLYALAR